MLCFSILFSYLTNCKKEYDYLITRPIEEKQEILAVDRHQDMQVVRIKDLKILIVITVEVIHPIMERLSGYPFQLFHQRPWFIQLIKLKMTILNLVILSQIMYPRRLWPRFWKNVQKSVIQEQIQGTKNATNVVIDVSLIHTMTNQRRQHSQL